MAGSDYCLATIRTELHFGRLEREHSPIWNSKTPQMSCETRHASNAARSDSLHGIARRLGRRQIPYLQSVRVLWADDSGIVLRTAHRLGCLMTALVNISNESVFLFWQRDGDDVPGRCEGRGTQSLTLTLLDNPHPLHHGDSDLSVEIARGVQRAWTYLRMYSPHLHERRPEPHRPKNHMLRSDIRESLLCGCIV